MSRGPETVSAPQSEEALLTFWNVCPLIQREVKAQECHPVKAAENHSEVNKKSGNFTYFKEKLLLQMYIIQLRNEAKLTAQE